MKISAKPLFIAYIVIIVLMVVGMFAFGDNYSFYVHREDPANDEVRFETEPEGIVELRDISATDEYYRVTVRAIKPGKTELLSERSSPARRTVRSYIPLTRITPAKCSGSTRLNIRSRSSTSS